MRSHACLILLLWVPFVGVFITRALLCGVKLLTLILETLTFVLGLEFPHVGGTHMKDSYRVPCRCWYFGNSP